MINDVSQFQALLYSILMRHKDELFKKFESQIENEVFKVDFKELVKKILYEDRLISLENKLRVLIYEEINNIVSKYFNETSIELKINYFIDRNINIRIENILKEQDDICGITSNKNIKPKFVITKPELLEKLPIQIRTILKHRDGNSEKFMSFSQISYKLDISVARVKTLQGIGLKKLENLNKKINGKDSPEAFEYVL